MTILIWIIACYLWFEVGKAWGKAIAYKEISEDLKEFDKSVQRIFKRVEDLDKTATEKINEFNKAIREGIAKQD